VADLLGSAIVSEGLRTYITAAEANGVISPVLCQTTGVVERIRVASVLDTERVAQLQIFARGEGLTAGEYALVELAVTDGAWVIETIGCYSGESAPEQEFPFTQRGQLLKSVPPPLDSNVWHLVFVENELPQVVPLGFATDSVCVAADGAEATCDQSQFVEAATVTAKGSMSESGPTVERLEFAQ